MLIYTQVHWKKKIVHPPRQWSVTLCSLCLPSLCIPSTPKDSHKHTNGIRPCLLSLTLTHYLCLLASFLSFLSFLPLTHCPFCFIINRNKVHLENDTGGRQAQTLLIVILFNLSFYSEVAWLVLIPRRQWNTSLLPECDHIHADKGSIPKRIQSIFFWPAPAWNYSLWLLQQLQPSPHIWQLSHFTTTTAEDRGVCVCVWRWVSGNRVKLYSSVFGN